MYSTELRQEISQGDIFLEVSMPVIAYEPGTKGGTLDIIPAPAILLSRDCEYDKKNLDYVLLSDVRPLSEVTEGSQGNVRNYKTLNTFYLEPIEGNLAEGYLNFRRIFRLPKAFIQSTRRLASLNDTARLALQRQIALYFGYDS